MNSRKNLLMSNVSSWCAGCSLIGRWCMDTCVIALKLVAEWCDLYCQPQPALIPIRITPTIRDH